MLQKFKRKKKKIIRQDKFIGSINHNNLGLQRRTIGKSDMNLTQGTFDRIHLSTINKINN